MDAFIRTHSSRVPPAPTSPPTSQNVLLLESTHEHGAENGVGSDDVVAAAGNQSETLNNGDALAGAPAWTITTRDNFNESINAVRDDLAESINTVNDRIDNVRDDLIQRLDGFSRRMLTIQVIAAWSFNASIPIAIPPYIVYEIVPFNNGDDPTLPPHALRPLCTKLDLDGLSHAQLRQYLRGYNLVAAVSVAAEIDLRRSLARYPRIAL
ncbi:hypothetical protein CPB85DRAFT_606478 [Mucidula mucida]|nr:hypothetical protein CPB85DRAFT_606478 [Mucidula mucida]